MPILGMLSINIKKNSDIGTILKNLFLIVWDFIKQPIINIIRDIINSITIKHKHPIKL